MKKLYLLRHAQAASALSGNDKDRPLTPHGIEQAKIIGRCLDKIDVVLCSTAIRTCMTLKALEDANAKVAKTEFIDDLYNAPAGDIMAAIQARSEEHVLIIAHNPGIHVLARTLAGGGETVLLEKMNLFFNPATLAIFDCPITSWWNIKPQENTLSDLIIPD